MADKKVERSGRERPITPSQKMKSALSDPGTVNIAESTHDKGKSALVDKFREREERWRRDQSLRDQEENAAHSREPEAEHSDGAAETGGSREDGAS
mgnify:FL=1